MGSFGVMVLSGTFTGDPVPAIAASRASALGLLDLTFSPHPDAALRALERLSRLAHREVGIKLDASYPELLAELVDRIPPAVRFVVVVPAGQAQLTEQITRLRRRELRVFLESISLEEAELGEALHVDGLIAKGHESGGRIGEESTFILLQRLLAGTSLPVWAHGGVGIHSAAGCRAAGAAGVVLDSQVLLARESRVSERARAVLSRMDGSETVCLPGVAGESFRTYAAATSLRAMEEIGESLRDQARHASADDALAAWRAGMRQQIDWSSLGDGALPVGQDAAMAVRLAARFVTVGGIVQGIAAATASHIQAARRLRPLDEGAPLARSHGTRYPIVQGPMTRVSDRAAFAARVAEEGALPFLALALLRRPQLDTLLEETRALLANRPWGVGILGFVPAELRHEQLAVIREHRPPFAIIAGGRPDQALSLERSGITTYLHVPSPGLLELFIGEGARRFVFEGRECGGHVGPRASLGLWDTMVEVLLKRLPSAELTGCHILFAGGVHDSVSASVVAATAAPLAEAGASIGVLLGTAYLFTPEAVTSRAIVPGFQYQALRCGKTVLLESGSGHATRCADTAFAATFQGERRRLLAEGRPPAEVRNALEELNLGRLRIASKGLERVDHTSPEERQLRSVSAKEQETRGMYMIGQVAALRQAVVPMAELHHDVSVRTSERLAQPIDAATHAESPDMRRGEDVAIVGMACVLPRAPDLATFRRNILQKVDAIREVPADRWDWRKYFDPDPTAADKIYSRSGGFLEDLPFDPTRWGIPPSTLPSIEPLQLLTLHAASAALDDAGYSTRPFPRNRTAVILGVGGGIAELGQKYVLRSELPRFVDKVSPEILDQLPQWTEDSFPGILLNVAAGRVANRLDLAGVNYTVDAACASSLTAVYLAAQELQAGTSDMVIVGGADTVQTPFAYLCFSKTQALSPTGRCRPFDAKADGIAISEGVALLVLKRLADAERDGDRVYAVLKAVAGSSDGRANGLTAPRPEGQALALERAYAEAGFPPSTVGLIEAHGTGTVAGDHAETAALKRVFNSAGAARQTCAIGSVKSMIGHTKCAAGVAGMVKVALALHHGVLPPTLNVDAPNPRARFDESPFYVNTEARPWIDGIDDQPRRAGVSAFGFGGTNFHAVLEEYRDELSDVERSPIPEWPAELFVWAGESPDELADGVGRVRQVLDRGAKPTLQDLASTLWRSASRAAPVRLSVVASSLEELCTELTVAQKMLTGADLGTVSTASYTTAQPMAREGKVAFLFPGQGSQHPDMLRELAVYIDEIRISFRAANRILADRFPKPLSSYVFPPPRFTPAEGTACLQQLTQTNVAQPALGAASCGLLRLLDALAIRPDALAGHSYGEYVALHAAGVFSKDVLFALSEARGRSIIDAGGSDLGTMATAAAEPEQVAKAVEGLPGVWIANINAPRATVLSGSTEGMARAVAQLLDKGIATQPLPVDCGFHSPMVLPAKERFAAFLTDLDYAPALIPVYSNTTADLYPSQGSELPKVLAEHMVSPVRFAEQIAAMHRDGVRIFIEVGPRGVLTGLVQQILADHPHLVVPVAGAPGGMKRLLQTLGMLWVHGVEMDLRRLFEGRATSPFDLQELENDSSMSAHSSTTWLVNGGTARPLGKQPENGSSGKSRDGLSAGLTSSKPARPAELPDMSAPTIAAPLSTQPTVAHGQNRPSSPPVTGADQAVVGFQQLMARFLDTQKHVMLSYLRHGGLDPQAADTALATNVADLSLPETGTTDAPPAVASGGESVSVEPVAHRDQVDAGSAAMTRADRELITRRLVELVAERTGYPPDVLGLDLDIESELGVDSIKRVEILGALRRSLGTPQEAVSETMDQLVGVRTLGGIVDWMFAAITAQDAVGDPPLRALPAPERPLDEEPIPRPDQELDPRAEVPRFVLEVVETPAPEAEFQAPSGTVLITDDGRGVAQHLAADLRSRGVTVVVVGCSPVSPTDDSGEVVDLADQDAVAGFLDGIRRRQGPIAGVIHLLPLHPGVDVDSMTANAWHDRLRDDVKTLFHLASAAAPDLKRAATHDGRAWLVAATQLGGSFGFGERPELLVPSSAGVAGLVKTLSQEWPGVHARIVDLPADSSPASSAAQLVSELSFGTGDVEVGYRGARRYAVRAVASPLVEDSLATPALGRESVLLVTGGGRGITGLVVRYLAQQYRSSFVIVGRSPVPELVEGPDTAGITAESELKAALIQAMRSRGEAASPAVVEMAYRRLRRDREIAENLRAIRAAGARVTYRQADVRDAAALAAVVEDVYRVHDRLDGVIHGAGVIDDKLIEDKTTGSFNAVFDTKAEAAFTFSRVLRADSLRFVVFFSSTAGRFGNAGQSDYAAGNETMSKIAHALARRCDARVVAVHWGPWQGAGMASAEVQRRFESRGVRLVEPSAGVRAFDRELRVGPGGPIEVVLGHGPWAVPADDRSPRPSPAAQAVPRRPLLLDCVPVEGRHELVVPLDPNQHRYLDDHQLDGRPVLPAAMALEIIAEAAALARPGWDVSEVHDLRVLNGVVVGDRDTALRVAWNCPPASPGQICDVDVVLTEVSNPARVHYRAKVKLSREPSPPPRPEPVDLGAEAFPLPIDEAYAQWLFHGPSLRCIRAIEALGEWSITASIDPSTPATCLDLGEGEWVVDPVVVDSAPQLVILWARARRGVTALPTAIARIQRFGSLEGVLRCHLRVRPDSDASTIVADASYIGAGGLELASVVGLQCTATAALNRLGGSRLEHLGVRGE